MVAQLLQGGGGTGNVTINQTVTDTTSVDFTHASHGFPAPTFPIPARTDPADASRLVLADASDARNKATWLITAVNAGGYTAIPVVRGKIDAPAHGLPLGVPHFLSPTAGQLITDASALVLRQILFVPQSASVLLVDGDIQMRSQVVGEEFPNDPFPKERFTLQDPANSSNDGVWNYNDTTTTWEAVVTSSQ